MFRYYLTIVLTSLIAAFPCNLIANDAIWTDAGYEMNWTSGNLEISSSQWNSISILKTYNDVTVTMPGGGGGNSILYV